MMKILLLSLCALLAVVSAVPVTLKKHFKSAKFQQSQHAQVLGIRTNFTVGHFLTKLDHFNPQDGRVANFSYSVNDAFYEEGGPLFFYISDNGQFTNEFLEVGLMADIAREVGAALITADNRYFRSNLPTENATFENLQFLTVEQIIVDISILIETTKDHLKSGNGSVILWGSGFGASLATWTKQTYPELVTGVWSSSGIYERSVISSAQFESLSNTITEVGGAICALRLERAYETLEWALQYVWDLDNVKEVFRLCFDPDENLHDVPAFFYGITKIISDYIDVNHFHGVQHLCEDLEEFDEEDLENEKNFESLGRWIEHVFTPSICLDLSFESRVFESSYFTNWSDISWLAWEPLNVAYPSVSRSQIYLSCTELGLFPTNVNADSIFGRSVAQDFYFHGCSEIFEDTDYNYLNLEIAIDNLNQLYGGKNPAVPNVIFTNGLLDSQLSFGITESYNETSTHVINIPNYAKSADLFSISEFDSISLVVYKEQIHDIIVDWC